MKISDAIKILEKIKTKDGDLDIFINGFGYQLEDVENIKVIDIDDKKGVEIGT